MSNNITNQISNSIQQNSQKDVLSKFENNIAVVLLTYNRLAFLKDLVHAIKNQTFKVAKIIVVNNSSTDGTAEWLSGVEGIEVITQANVGSSGGQYTGIKAAYSTGLEWIWTMDDDV
jgi:rhamnopyranosyl-N-acetylglucosaminyl-diphospho-decaprenol beta-1,3/1,4-galactofuranosyltransferase